VQHERLRSIDAPGLRDGRLSNAGDAEPLALGAGVLRISADMRWATDVMMGAAAGTALGVAVPFFLHQRDEQAPRVAIAPSITSEHVMFVAAGSF